MIASIAEPSDIEGSLGRSQPYLLLLFSRSLPIIGPDITSTPTSAPPKDVQVLVDKLHTQKGITITQKTLAGANHFFPNDAELLLEECSDYLDRRLAGELSDPRPKRLR